MSEGTDISTSTHEVYVPLLGEGTDVRRPTRAVACGPKTFRLLATDDYDPDDEIWEFLPGTVVECRPGTIGGREVLVAIARAGSTEDPPNERRTTKPHDARAVANHLLGLAAAEGEALTPMKLQNLVYFAHGWSLAVHDSPLISEQVQAWNYGPVFPNLDRAFKDYGGGPVDSPAVVDESSGRYGAISGWTTPDLHDDPEARRLVRKVWDVYKKFTGVQLSNWTHVPGSPWRTIFDEHHGSIPHGRIIPDSSIKDYFVGLASARTSVR